MGDEAIWGEVVQTMQAPNMQAVLAGNSGDFGLAPLREGFAGEFMHQSIMTTDVESWRFSRSVIKPMFARVEIANLAFLETSVTRLIRKVPTDGSTVDLQPLF